MWLVCVLIAAAGGAAGRDVAKYEEYIQNFVLPRPCSAMPNFTEYVLEMEYLDEMMKVRPIAEATEEYTKLLMPYIECSPPPIKVHKRPQNLTLDCNSNGWVGTRATPAYMVDIFPFAHELDVLEMRLYELDDVIDQFVLFENVYTHRVWKRPLFYARNKFRFERFNRKIFHVIADDSQHAKDYKSEQVNGDYFAGEIIMRQLPWSAFRSVVGDQERLKNMIFIHGDLDEIPNAHTILHYKHCVPGPSLTLPIVLTTNMYRQNFDYYIWPWESPILFDYHTMENRFGHMLPRRNTGMNKHNVESERGYHCNRLTNAYGDIFKDLALAEGGYVPRFPDKSREILLNPLVTNAWRSKGIRNCCTGDTAHLKKRVAGMPIPWFAWHNKHRFPEYFPDECAANPAECTP